MVYRAQVIPDNNIVETEQIHFSVRLTAKNGGWLVTHLTPWRMVIELLS